MTERSEEWEEIGERIRNERQYRGYSQQQIADYLDISRSSVSLMENGERKISSIELRQLADFFNTTIDYLVNESSPDSTADQDVQMVARAARELSREDREEVIRFAEFLRSRDPGSVEDD
jgi:transcriptional regulator with XRE-family HTH domain